MLGALMPSTVLYVLNLSCGTYRRGFDYVQAVADDDDVFKKAVYCTGS